MNPTLALLGAIPALLAMLVFDWLDAKRPEPPRTRRLVALGGMLAAVPVVLVGEALKLVAPDGVFGPSGASASYAGALYLSFAIAAFPEEAGKIASVWLFAARRPEFDERVDGIVYGARAGLGFALVENIVYLLMLPSTMGEYMSIFLGRAVLAVPGHATWGGIAGYFWARRRFDGRGPGLAGGYLVAAGLHGLYDAWVFSAPVAIERGHTWMALGIAGVPVVVYAVPFAIVIGGALWLRRLSALALREDDLADNRRARARFAAARVR